MTQVVFNNNIKTARQAFDNACKRGLSSCGSTAEGYAKKEVPVDTGALRNSISNKLDGDRTVAIGTNMEYAPYVELGTGVYYPSGRKTSWVYQDAKSDWHMTHGQKARPYLKPAVADHSSEYQKIIEDSFKNA